MITIWGCAPPPPIFIIYKVSSLLYTIIYSYHYPFLIGYLEDYNLLSLNCHITFASAFPHRAGYRKHYRTNAFYTTIMLPPKLGQAEANKQLLITLENMNKNNGQF